MATTYWAALVPESVIVVREDRVLYGVLVKVL